MLTEKDRKRMENGEVVVDQFRGGPIYLFTDSYGQLCTIQWGEEPDGEGNPRIYIGAVEPCQGEAYPPTRMFLTDKQLRAVLPLLNAFAETGEWPCPPPETPGA